MLKFHEVLGIVICFGLFAAVCIHGCDKSTEETVARLKAQEARRGCICLEDPR